MKLGKLKKNKQKKELIILNIVYHDKIYIF